MVIAVDAVGGDHYPQNPIKGAISALEDNQQLQIMLLGPEEMIREELENLEYDEDRLHVQDAPDIIGMNESPTQAVKGKQNSSIVKGLGLHKAGKTDAFVSAGNTGALLAASTFILGKLEGIIRPTIATLFPTVKGFRLLVDAGANLELKAEMYLQFATMGSIYAREVMQIEDPKVGLLNVGEEEEKGTACMREAYKLLREMPNFVGNIEGRDILPAKADVFVSDGLVGNILLKFGESVPVALEVLIGSTLKEMGGSDSSGGSEKMKMIMKKALAQFDHENVGGVPFLGVNGVSIVGHGGSSPRAMKNMILNAARCAGANVNDKIVDTLNG